MSYVNEAFERIKARNSNEKEFLQAVEEVFESLEPVIEKPRIEPSDVDIDIPRVGTPDPNRYALIIGNEDYSTYQRGLQRESDVEFAIHDGNYPGQKLASSQQWQD